MFLIGVFLLAVLAQAPARAQANPMMLDRPSMRSYNFRSSCAASSTVRSS